MKIVASGNSNWVAKGETEEWSFLLQAMKEVPFAFLSTYTCFLLIKKSSSALLDRSPSLQVFRQSVQVLQGKISVRPEGLHRLLAQDSGHLELDCLRWLLWEPSRAWDGDGWEHSARMTQGDLVQKEPAAFTIPTTKNNSQVAPVWRGFGCYRDGRHNNQCDCSVKSNPDTGRSYSL